MVLMPLKYFGVRMPATMASTSLSTLLKAHFGLGMVSSTPFWVVPSHESHGVSISSATGAQRQGHAGGDAAEDDLDLVLEDELAVALDGVLRRRFLLDDELDLAAEDAARLVHALRPPLGAAQPRRADGRRDARADGDDADLHGIRRHARPRLGPRRRPGSGRAAAAAVPTTLRKSRLLVAILILPRH